MTRRALRAPRYSRKQQGSKHWTYLSLFAGCGGFDHGFQSAGFRCVGALDIDPIALDVNRANLGTPTTLADLAGPDCRIPTTEPVTAIVAGPPCQGFSTAGKRDNKDPRNELLLVPARLAVRLRPQVVVVENVRGVLSGAQRAHWQRLHTTLRDAGYSTADVDCSGPDLGMAQKRNRIVAVAWLGLNTPVLTFRRRGPTNLRDVLSRLSREPDHRPRRLAKGSRDRLIAARVKRGQKLSDVRLGPSAIHSWDIPEVFGKTTARERQLLERVARLRRRNRKRAFGDGDPVTVADLAPIRSPLLSATLHRLVATGYLRRSNAGYDLVRTYNGKYRRLEWDRPSPTVDTHYGDPRSFLHPDYPRPFTVREAARVQGFPDDFHFGKRSTVAMRLIGNAVPPPMARAIALMVRAQLTGA